jgi:hypothetical protein
MERLFVISKQNISTMKAEDDLDIHQYEIKINLYFHLIEYYAAIK